MTSEAEAKAKRDALIERIRKLQRMTTERGASENEAAQAAALVARLIAEHNVGESELSLRADAASCVKDVFSMVGSARNSYNGLLGQLSRMYGTIHSFRKVEEDILGLGFTTVQTEVTFYGYPLDVAGSIATLAMCILAIDREVANCKLRAAAKRESFERGMFARLIERLAEMEQRNFGEAKGRGAIVLVKKEIVEEEARKAGYKGGRTVYAQKIALDAGAYAKGRAAAEAVPLSKGVGARAQGRLA